MAKVSPPAITRAIREGRAAETHAGKMDLNDPLNKLFLASHHRKPLTAEVRAAAGRGAGGSSSALARKRLQAEITLKTEQALTHRQRRLVALGRLWERDLAERRLALIGQEIRVRLLDLPQRTFPQVMALIKSGREDEALLHLEGEIGKAMEHVIGKATA